MNADAVTNRKDTLLPFKEKLAFFSVNLGNIPIMTMMSYYLLMFYTDVVGLNPVAVGTLFLIARIMDGVSDPIMGYVIDHLPRTRMGRFRSYLLMGVVVCSLNFSLVWLGPSLAPSGKLLIAYISYLLIGWTFDVMDIPLNSMIPVMSDKDRDRNTLSVIKGTAYMIGTVIIVGAGLPLINLFPTKQEGFHTIILVITTMVLLLSILGTLGIKERIFPVTKEKYNPGNIKQILGARPVLVLFVETLVSQIGSGVNAGTLVFFFQYALKRPDLFPVGAASYIVGILVAAAIAPALIKRFGKKACQTFSFILSIIGSVAMFFTPLSMPYMFIVIAMLTSPGIGMSTILSYGIQADNMDYIEWKRGFRAEGAVASLNSFIVKAGGGIGSAISAYLLAYFRYVPNAEIQAAGTIRGFYYINYAIPAGFALVALLVWTLGYPLTKKVTAQMMEELAQRRLKEA